MENIIKEQKVKEQYEQLCNMLPKEVTKEQRKQIDEAFIMAYKAHQGTLRKTGDPYIVHPLNVAEIVIKKLKLDTASIIAALLHDVPEDTEVTLEDIEKAFGKEIATIVEGLTKVKEEIPWHQPKHATIFQAFLRNLSKDRRIILIKLADRLDNMRSLHAMPRSKQLHIATETKKLYVPIANRLGLNKFKTELEDVYLKITNPEDFFTITRKLDKTIKQREKEMDIFIKPIEKALKEQGFKFRTSKRAKSIYSIYNKMQKKKICLEQVYDKTAIRIILDTQQEKITCWQVYGIVTSLYTPHNKRKKDWISTPKSNGYESLHITVLNQNKEWVEVQIRTERMDAIATHGIAAHWKYKSEKLIENFNSWLQDISHLAVVGADTMSMMDQLEIGFSTIDEIAIMLHDGRDMQLPKGATVLDCAIQQFGAKGIYVKYAFVNQELVPIHHVLKQHDKVRIELDPKKDPNPNIINIVVTPKASSIVQEFFRDKQQQEVAAGEKTLKKVLKEHNLSYNDAILEYLRDFIGEKTITSLLVNIAHEKTNLNDIIMKFSKTMAQYNHAEKKPFFDKRKVFLVKETNAKEYELANCCKPIANQDIFGVMLGNRKIRIHTVHCEIGENVLSRYGGRIVETQWYNPPAVEVAFFVKFLQNKNVPPAILDALIPFEVQSFYFSQRDEHAAQANISVIFKDCKEMEALIERLKNIGGVKEVVKD